MTQQVIIWLISMMLRRVTPETIRKVIVLAMQQAKALALRSDTDLDDQTVVPIADAIIEAVDPNHLEHSHAVAERLRDAVVDAGLPTKSKDPFDPYGG